MRYVDTNIVGYSKYVLSWGYHGNITRNRSSSAQLASGRALK